MCTKINNARRGKVEHLHESEHLYWIPYPKAVLKVTRTFCIVISNSFKVILVPSTHADMSPHRKMACTGHLNPQWLAWE
jgi:hypothetical protein